MDETIISLLDVNEIALAMGAQVVHPQPLSFQTISTDSRQVSSKDLFIALSGERFDAHDFIPQVIEKGCRGVVISKKIDIPDHVTAFFVEDVLKAFGKLAAAILDKRRSLDSFTTYAVTGSNGKTTTKEILALLLEARKFNVLKTEGNHNNFVGLPMTVLNLRRSHDAAVLEMGANAPGEIAYLSGLGKPDIAIITCIAPAHLEGFGSIEGVASAKGEMIDSPRLKTIVLPTQTRKYYENRIPAHVTPIWVGDETSKENTRFEHVVSSLDGIVFDIIDGNKTWNIRLPLLGSHNAGNMTRAWAAAQAASLSNNEINRAMLRIHLPSGRLERWTNASGLSFLHDAYNANPSSMTQAIDLMAQFKAPKCLILGDMRELGHDSDKLHHEIGKLAAKIHPVRLLCVGDNADFFLKGAIDGGLNCNDVHVCSSNDLESGLKWLEPSLTPDTVCLIKGSRGVSLERVLSFFDAHRV